MRRHRPLFAGGGGGRVLPRPRSPGFFSSSSGVDFFVGIGFSVFGALIVSRRPDNAVGWVLLGIAVAATTEAVAFQYAILAQHHGLPGAAWAGWLQNWVTIAIFPSGLLLFLILLFPTGRPLSRWWRWLMGAAAAMTAAGIVMTMVDP